MAGPAGTWLRDYHRLTVVATWSENPEQEGCFPDDDRCSADCQRLLQWVGSSRGRQEGHGIWEQQNVPGALQLSVADGRHDGHSVFCSTATRRHSSTALRQRYNDRVPEQPRWVSKELILACHGHLGRALPPRNTAAALEAFGRLQE